MGKEIYVTSLVSQARECREIIEESFANFTEATLRVIPSVIIHRIQKVVLTGCGDSYAAALAAKSVFESVAQLEAQAMLSTDLSRMSSPKEFGFAPFTPLVIGASVSGNVSRVEEAIQFAGSHGACTLAVTDSVESPIARAADHVLQIGLPKGRNYRPGCNSYTGILIALTCLALRFARARSTVSANLYTDMRKSICDYAADFESVFEDIDCALLRMAETWSHLKGYEYISDGQDYATAYVGAAKCHEAFGGYTRAVDSDTWMVQSRHLASPALIGRVFIINSNSRSKDRLCSAARCAVQLGSPTLIVTNEAGLRVDGVEMLVTPCPRYDFLSPLIQHYPLAMLAGYIAGYQGYKTLLRLTLPEYQAPNADDTSRIRSSKIEIR